MEHTFKLIFEEYTPLFYRKLRRGKLAFGDWGQLVHVDSIRKKAKRFGFKGFENEEGLIKVAKSKADKDGYLFVEAEITCSAEALELFLCALKQKYKRLVIIVSGYGGTKAKGLYSRHPEFLEYAPLGWFHRMRKKKWYAYTMFILAILCILCVLSGPFLCEWMQHSFGTRL